MRALTELPRFELELPIGDNAFALLGVFQQTAKRNGWTSEEIKIVFDIAMKGDYEHLCETLEEYCI